MSQCPECNKDHPEDTAIEAAGVTWEQITDWALKDEWPLASKLAKLLLEIGNECEHQWHRAEFFSRFAPTNEKKGE